jgi:hypothetical protein
MKKTSIQKIILVISSIPIFVASCNKKYEEPADITPTIENVSGTYVVIAQTINGVNKFDEMEACKKDDLYEFAYYSAPDTAGVFKWNDTGLICGGSSINGATARWSLNNSQITYFGGISGTITSFNGSRMVISALWAGNSFVTTYRKQ